MCIMEMAHKPCCMTIPLACSFLLTNILFIRVQVRLRTPVQGKGKATFPPGHTWHSFARFLLETLPQAEREHFETKILAFLKWHADRGFVDGIPDEADPKLEAGKKAPSWRRICKVILKNDRMCRGLGFSQHVSGAYDKYRKLMKRMSQQWGLMN